MATKLLITFDDPIKGGVIEAEIASINLRGADPGGPRPAESNEVVIVHSDHNLNSTLSRYQQNGTPIKKVLIRKVEIAGKSGSVRTLQSWELRDVAVASIATTSREGEPVYSATFLFGALSVHGTVVGLEDQQFEDPDPRLVYEHQVVERVQQELPLEDDHATAVILVCRNEWNTLNSHSTGFHWFSA